MNDQIESLETQFAMLQKDMNFCQEGLKKDINLLKSTKQDLPEWLKNSAIIVLIAMFGQIMTSVWWAASMTTQLNNVQKEVSINTEFRMEYPALHEEIMVELKGITTENKHIKSMLKELKDKLRFVNIQTQHNKVIK